MGGYLAEINDQNENRFIETEAQFLGSTPSMFFYMSLVVRKQVFGVFDLVPHKPGYTAIEDCYRLEIPDLGRRGIALSM